MDACVLVVDDDREIVRAIALLLEKEGYRVLKAYDGMEALRILAEQEVQLIIMDVMMPKLDGLSAMMKIRERKNLPIIVLSAKTEDTDKILGLSMGADDYVAKPFNPQELAARVKSQLRRYTMLGGIHAQSEADEIVNGLLPPSGTHALCGRGAGQTDRHGDEDHGASDEKQGAHLPGGGDLRESLGGAVLCAGEHGDGAHQTHPGENRTQSERARIYKGGVGHWIQDGKKVRQQAVFWLLRRD